MNFFSRTVQELKKTVKSQDIFDAIYLRDDIKFILKRALLASKPVHVLLVGKQGCGKTVFLDSICASYGRRAMYLDFTSTTKAGALNEIVAKRPKIVCCDEIEKASKDVRSGFLNMMQNGNIKYTLRSKVIDEHIGAWVIATCNHIDDLEKIQPEFLDRMIVIHVKEYSEEEYYKIAQFALAKQHVTAELARYIAEQVLEKFGEQKLRKCIDVAAMAKTQEDIDDVLEVMT